ncbi:glycosyltransferase [Oleidesulfovibrio alaskensis]
MKLALFFSRGISLADWNSSGLLDRETAVYARLLDSEDIEHIYWITYGKDDGELAAGLQRAGRLPENLTVLPMPALFASALGRAVYSLAAPVFCRRIIRHVAVVKSNQMDGAWTPLLAKMLFGKRFFARTGYTASLFRKREKGARSVQHIFYCVVEAIVYRFADAASVTSYADYDHIVSNYAVRRAFCIPNYVDTGRFVPARKTCCRMLFAGRLNAQKNVEALIGAVAETGAGLDVYGGGALLAQLEGCARTAGADVVFHGVVSQNVLAEALRHARFFVLPSLYEGLPKALLEAMACGCICIVTPVEGSSEVIADGRNGIVASGSDAASLADALRRAMALLPDDRERMAAAARKTVMDRYSLQAVAESELQLLKRLALGVPVAGLPDDTFSGQTPRVSVLLCVHNGQPFVSAAVDSVLQQTFSDFELIIADDGSTDDTPRILRAYAARDKRVRVVTLAAKGGLTRALNIALSYAKAPLVARIDADDLWLPEKLEKQYAVMCADSSLVMLGTAYDCVDGAGEFAGPQDVALISGWQNIRQAVCRFNPFFHSSVMFRRKHACAAGGYDLRFKTAQDYALWLKLLGSGRGDNLPDTLARRRIHGQMISQVRRRSQRFYAVLARLKNVWCLKHAGAWKGLAADCAVVLLPAPAAALCRKAVNVFRHRP